MNLEKYFEPFRENTIGRNQTFQSPFGEQKIIYADWIASGRIYTPIEEKLRTEIFPFVGNTHTETSITGATMSLAFHKALNLIKKHVGANKDDIIISAGAGMTMLVSKFQRILGLKVHEKYQDKIKIKNRPIVFVTHMEHHSNQTSWIETIAEVKLIPHTRNGGVDLEKFKVLLENYKDRNLKIAAVTSCSNVTGVFTPYYEIAEIMHQNNGLCFVDFACSAPYIDIDMHPKNPMQKLDAIYFSPHKFLGGPGATGILVFDKKLYTNKVPDSPGGGTVDWTNPWGGHKYVEDIQEREDGGTPAFLQTIKTALCFQLKAQMGVKNILDREHELHQIIWRKLSNLDNVTILADNFPERLGVYSFYIDDCHFNLAVQLLNDRFGIQVRGGCSCAGTYGHILLNVDMDFSHNITDRIDSGDLTLKPGWVRMSIHPTMTDEEVHFIMNAIEELAENHKDWAKDYFYNKKTNEFLYKDTSFSEKNKERAESWFKL
ncbi:MAG: aminotransferase class V-fold PLP-dependent enzyme [Flavobacteriales bacterium]|nr:aminotransferase class V-fold PLP-dependent enzyme [Flavobacteriales bacterium]